MNFTTYFLVLHISKKKNLPSMILSFKRFGILLFEIEIFIFKKKIFGQEKFGKLHNYFELGKLYDF